MGSMSVPQEAEAPQQELPSPLVTRRAAAPYRSFTTSLISCVLIFVSPRNCSGRHLQHASLTTNNALRFHHFVAGAALGVQKTQQLGQRLGVRRVAQESAFPPHLHQFLILQLVQMV